MPKEIATPTPVLTDYEMRVLVLSSEGFTLRDISTIEERTYRSVGCTLERVREKLDACNKAHAVHLGYQYGILKVNVSNPESSICR